MIRSGQASPAPRRGRIRRTAPFVLAFGLLGSGAAFAEPSAPPADEEVAEDATEVAEPAEASSTETPTAMRAPDEPGVRVKEHKRWTGGSDALASAVEAYNGTTGGQEAPLTVEAVEAAIRRGFQDWDRTTTAPYDWVLRGEKAPRGGWIQIIRLDPSSEVNGSKLFVELNAPGAPTRFQFPIPEANPAAEAPEPGLSVETQERIAAALAAAADDENLPTQTRLRLLRATVKPGELSAERTKALYDRLSVLLRGEEFEKFFQEAPVMLKGLDEFEAGVPDVTAAHLVSGVVNYLENVEFASLDDFQNDSPELAAIIPPARRILKRSAGTAEGLSILLEASQADAGESLPTEWLPTQDVLLNVVRNANPTTDALAAALLEGAASDDPQVRAAALEALAGAD